MAKEHHCPNDGRSPCFAANGRTHVCPRCGARWEELVEEIGVTPAAPSA